MAKWKNPGAAATGASGAVHAERLSNPHDKADVTPRQVLLGDIDETPDLQMREAGIDPHTVQDYAEAMEGGAEFPPITLYHDGKAYWPADGFHRIAAARRLRWETIKAK